MKKFWLLLLLAPLLMVVYFLYQNSFIEHFDEEELIEETASVDPDKTLLVSAEEENFTFQKKGFSQLFESLKFWNFDEEKEALYLREESLSPTELTPVLFIYSRGNNSFENQENIIPITNFPYNVSQNDTSLDMLNYDENGKMYFMFRDKKIVLEPGETYYDIWFENFSLRNIKIRNFGMMDEDQFKVLDSDKDNNDENNNDGDNSSNDDA